MAGSYELLTRAHERAMAFLNSLPERPVAARASFDELVVALGGPLPEASQDPLDIVGDLTARLEPGLTANAGPRYFGFVTGGSYPVAVAADWLVSAWDQNAALHIMSPAMSALEACTATWILDALGLPEQSSVGFVTGAHTANITALAAARHELVLRRARWDVEALGLQGAPTADGHRGRGGALIYQRRVPDDWRRQPDDHARRRRVSRQVLIELDLVEDVDAGLIPYPGAPERFRFMPFCGCWVDRVLLPSSIVAADTPSACPIGYGISPARQVLNEVALNQVLARFSSPSGENITNQVIAAVQAAGVCWCGGTMWAGEPAMRISVSNWRTSEDDIDRSAESILQAVERVRVG